MTGTADSREARRFQLRVAFQFWLLAAVLRPLKHVVPLPLLVRAVRFRRYSSRISTTRAAAILQYMGATDRFPRRPPANCLERSLAAYVIRATALVDTAFQRYDRLRSVLIARFAPDAVLDAFNDLTYGASGVY